MSSASDPASQPSAGGDLIDLSGDGGVLKQILVEGAGDKPKTDDEVLAHYTGRLTNGTKFDSSVDRTEPFKFVLGRQHVIKGWDLGFASMRKGEKAILTIASEYGYGKAGSPPSIPGGATLVFEVELLSFAPKERPYYELTKEERMEKASMLKDQGNALFKKGDFDMALADYESAVQHLSTYNDPLETVVELNMAQCLLQLGRFGDAIKHANKVLEKDPDNLKAHYRKGLALKARSQMEEARTELSRVLELDPENIPAKKELELVRRAERMYEQKEKKAFKGMFSKVTFYDDKKPAEPVAEKKEDAIEEEDDGDDE